MRERKRGGVKRTRKAPECSHRLGYGEWAGGMRGLEPRRICSSRCRRYRNMSVSRCSLGVVLRSYAGMATAQGGENEKILR